jgi:DNA-binding protein H-NS
MVTDKNARFFILSTIREEKIRMTPNYKKMENQIKKKKRQTYESIFEDRVKAIEDIKAFMEQCRDILKDPDGNIKSETRLL